MDILVEHQGEALKSRKTTSSNLIPALAPVARAINQEALLERRIEQSLRQKAPEPTYEFTSDPGLLQQYFMIRKDMYFKVFGHVHSDQADECDKVSNILLGHVGNLCIGGARLTIKDYESRSKFSFEENGFDVKDYFPELQGKRIAEVSRIALLPEYHGGECTYKMFGCIKAYCLRNDVSMLFMVSTKRQARLNGMMFKKLNLIFQTYDIEAPEKDIYEGLKMYLSGVRSEENFADGRPFNFVENATPLKMI